MSYGRDRNARTRGVGAIAAIDHVSSKRRRMATLGALEMARRDHKLALLSRTAFRPMAMGRMKSEDPAYESPVPGNPRTSGGGTVNTGPVIKTGPAPTCVFPYGMVNGQCVLIGGIVPPTAPPKPTPMPPTPLPGKGGGFSNPGDQVYTTPPIWTQGGGTVSLPPPLPDPLPPKGGGTTGTNTPPIIGGGGGGGGGGPSNTGIVPPPLVVPPTEELPPIGPESMSNTTKYVLLGVLALGGYFIWKESKGA